MTTPDRPDGGAAERRREPPAGEVDSGNDALARRAEEFRRFLVSVVGPAFLELRETFRADGREVEIIPYTDQAAPAEATIAISYQGNPEFAYSVGARLNPERAVVMKRRLVAIPGVSPLVRVEEAPLLQSAERASDARSISRADVVASVRTDYWLLRRSMRDR